jgi:hypothetical protein
MYTRRIIRATLRKWSVTELAANLVTGLAALWVLVEVWGWLNG